MGAENTTNRRSTGGPDSLMTRPSRRGRRGQNPFPGEPSHAAQVLTDLDTTREIRAHVEAIRINPDTLWADNHSTEAERKRNEFLGRYDTGRSSLVCSCCDARVLQMLPGEQTHLITSIGVGGTKDLDFFRPAEEVDVVKVGSGPKRGQKARANTRRAVQERETAKEAKDPDIIYIITHYPCGAQNAKAADDEKVPATPGLGRYIREEVLHWDPVYNALLQAEEAALKHPGSTIVAGTLHNNDGQIVPLGVHMNGEWTLPGRKAFADYNPDPRPEYQLPPDQLPQLSLAQLPERARKYVVDQKKHAARLQTELTDFEDAQSVQNPIALVFDEPQANPTLSTRYPRLFGKPGIAFRIQIQSNGTRKDSLKMFDEVLEQAEFAVANNNFDRMRTVIFQTSSERTSRELARKFMKSPVGRAWKEKYPDGEILLTVSVRGKLQKKPVFFEG